MSHWRAPPKPNLPPALMVGETLAAVLVIAVVVFFVVAFSQQ